MRSWGTVILLWSLPGWAFAQELSSRCSWEDGSSTILGSYGNLGEATNVGFPDPVHTGNRALRLVESPEGGTPQAFLAFVEGLQDGDVIEACFWTHDETDDSAPSVRIWAHYADAGMVDSHKGTASGNPSYSFGGGWNEVCHTWTFESLGGFRTALVVEARLYSPSGEGATFFLDDLEVSVSSSQAQITLPCVGTIPIASSQTWGSIKGYYRE